MRKIKENILALGLSPKKEFIRLLLVDLTLLIGGVLSYFLLKQLTVSAGLIGFILVFTLFYLTRYPKMISKKNIDNLQEFTTLFGYFKIYIHNGFSVYSALKELLNFANRDLKEKLQKLISDIDEDKSVKPFADFGKQFNELIVEEMMISIYQLIDDGESSNYLGQFELIFDKFSDVLYQKYLKTKDTKLGRISSSALIGSCFLIIVLTIGIIGIIGELINGV